MLRVDVDDVVDADQEPCPPEEAGTNLERFGFVRRFHRACWVGRAGVGWGSVSVFAVVSGAGVDRTKPYGLPSVRQWELAPFGDSLGDALCVASHSADGVRVERVQELAPDSVEAWLGGDNAV